MPEYSNQTSLADSNFTPSRRMGLINTLSARRCNVRTRLAAMSFSDGAGSSAARDSSVGHQQAA